MQIDLDSDAALVLFELLASREEQIVSALQLEAAERNALWCLEGSLEKVLVGPLSPSYGALLQNARKSLVERGGE